MIENLKNINDRNLKLNKMSEKDVEAMYLRVFNTADGEMIMQDLANRCFVNSTTFQGEPQPVAYYCEGMRAMWLTIQSRIQNAVQPQQKEDRNV